MKVNISVIEQYCCNRVFALYSATFQRNLKPACVYYQDKHLQDSLFFKRVFVILFPRDNTSR